jgi:hypothetical protein
MIQKQSRFITDEGAVSVFEKGAGDSPNRLRAFRPCRQPFSTLDHAPPFASCIPLVDSP